MQRASAVGAEPEAVFIARTRLARRGTGSQQGKLREIAASEWQVLYPLSIYHLAQFGRLGFKQRRRACDRPRLTPSLARLAA